VFESGRGGREREIYENFINDKEVNLRVIKQKAKWRQNKVQIPQHSGVDYFVVCVTRATFVPKGLHEPIMWFFTLLKFKVKSKICIN
jgi:hypothetical protein